MTVVVDASAALCWLLRSQATPAADAFLSRYGDELLVAPHIFQWEVGNVLLSLERRRILIEQDYEKAIRSFADLAIETVPPLNDDEVARLSEVARVARLSLFDACYLQLALEGGFGLASRDADLMSAAKAVGIQCFDLRGAAIP